MRAVRYFKVGVFGRIESFDSQLTIFFQQTPHQVPTVQTLVGKDYSVGVVQLKRNGEIYMKFLLLFTLRTMREGKTLLALITFKT